MSRWLALLNANSPEQKRWTPAEADAFFRHTAADPMGLLFRVSTLCPSRRSEIFGLQWRDWDDGQATFEVQRVMLQLGGKLVLKDRPKTKSSERLLSVDAETATLIRARRETLELECQYRGEELNETAFVFTDQAGQPWKPDYVTKRFKKLCAAAGVPVIKYNEGGRHTANRLNYDAEVREDVAMREAGHTTRKTSQRYNHPLREAHREAAEKRAELVRKAGTSS
jgi:integrase